MGHPHSQAYRSRMTAPRKLTLIFYKSGPEQGYTLLEAGMFGFYAPEDGHMPCIAVTEAQPATKIVFKIPVKG